MGVSVGTLSGWLLIHLLFSIVSWGSACWSSWNRPLSVHLLLWIFISFWVGCLMCAPRMITTIEWVWLGSINYTCVQRNLSVYYSYSSVQRLRGESLGFLARFLTPENSPHMETPKVLWVDAEWIDTGVKLSDEVQTMQHPWLNDLPLNTCCTLHLLVARPHGGTNDTV